MRLIDYLGDSVELNILKKIIKEPNKLFKISDFPEGARRRYYKKAINLFVKRKILKQEKCGAWTRYKLNRKIINDEIIGLLNLKVDKFGKGKWSELK